MRKSIQKLLDRTDCILSTGYSFLFVTNIEKKKYKEMWYESHFKEGFAKVSEVILDSEWEEIETLIDKGEVLWDYEHLVFENPIDYEKMKLKVINKKSFVDNTISNNSFEEEYKEGCLMDIRKIREKLNMSQSQFANKFHLSVKTLQRWEQGQTKVPESIYYMINRIYELEQKDK